MNPRKTRFLVRSLEGKHFSQPVRFFTFPCTFLLKKQYGHVWCVHGPYNSMHVILVDHVWLSMELHGVLARNNTLFWGSRNNAQGITSEANPCREKKHVLQESCKTIMKNVNLAKFWQKKQILQESDRKVISCKNLARFLKDLYHQEEFLARFTHYADKNTAAN